MYGKSLQHLCIFFLSAFLGGSVSAGILYPGATTWWAYMYQGDKAAPGAASTALDGKWSHDNGSDVWDESALGAGKGASGGASALTEEGVTFLRIQDPGDPRPNPADPSNRKIMFGHVMTELKAPAADTILDSGVTITFRARIPTSGLLDELNSGGTKTPYPAGGDGYVLHDGGKDNFSVRQSSGDKIVSFALALAADDNEMQGKSGLVMNKLNGAAPSADVDMQTDDAGTVNILELDPTQWHEFWITIEADASGTGTHVVNIYVDGSMEPEVFYVTAGDGDDFSSSYISMGVGATPQSGAIDVDFFGYKAGAYPPDGIYAAGNPSPADGDLAVTMPLFTWTPGSDAVSHNMYLGTTPELSAADLVLSRFPSTLHYHNSWPLQPGTQYFWRIDENGADGTTVHRGKVWSFVTQGLTAYYPTPADGANDAAPAPTLIWLPGQGTLEHHLYFSSDAGAVSQRAAGADKGPLSEATFAPGTLDTLATYYWAVDEKVAIGGTQAGPVWHFTTYLPVDDFESYNDEENQGTRIYETWLDGYVDASSGSMVGYTDPPFAEQKIVHGGAQSMPLDYNNVNTPFYSEAVRELDPAADWTVSDANMLVLHIQGKRTNAAIPLYVALEDASKHRATVVHPDPNIAIRTRWTEWKIPTSDFAGVNLTKVKKMYIGLGDRADPKPGGTGLLFIDDIYLTKP